MGKAKWAELEQARRDGIGYALGIVREKGIEGLEEDVRFRNIINEKAGCVAEGYTTVEEQLEILEKETGMLAKLE